MITMADIRKRIDNLNSHFIKCEFNINNMNIYSKSPQSTEKIIYNNAMYMINNWRSFNEDTNIAYDRALDIFDEICESGNIKYIKESYTVLYENINKVRDTSQLLNSLKYRIARLKNGTRSTTKITSKLDDIQTASASNLDNLNAKLRAGGNVKLPAASLPSGPSSSTPSSNNNTSTDNDIEECYNNLIEAAEVCLECDRIIKNYNTISKRFNLDKMVNDIINENTIYDTIAEICECIDTYNTSFKTKYNTCLETIFYTLNSNHIKYSNKSIIESVTDYFVFNYIIDESKIEDIKDIISVSEVFTMSDFSSIDYLFDTKQINESFKDKSTDEIVMEYEYLSENETVDKLKSDIKEWPKGTPDSREDKEIVNMIDDFRSKCKKEEDSGKLVNLLRNTINKIFGKSPYQIVNELPNLFGIIRVFFILSTCAIHPVISVVTFLTDNIIKLYTRRPQVEKVIAKYKVEISTVKSKIEKEKNNDKKDRLEKYLKELEKDLKKIEDYEDTLYSEEENDERRFSKDNSDIDFDFDFEFEDDDFMDESQINNAIAIICISELMTSIYESLNDESLSHVITENISKFDNDTLDLITDISLISPMIVDKNVLKESLINRNDQLRGSGNIDDMITRDALYENIYRLDNAKSSYNTTNNINALICTLESIDKMVKYCNSTYITEMNFINNLKLAADRLKKTVIKLSDKEKAMCNSLDLSVRSFTKSMEDAYNNDRKQAILKGHILPSASKAIKIALVAAAAWAVNPAIAIIGAIGAFACNRKMEARERQIILDDIDIELNMCERYMRKAEEKDDMNAVRQIEIIQRNLLRQKQRIQYKMAVSTRKQLPSVDNVIKD